MISLTQSFNNMATTLDSDTLPIKKFPLYIPDTEEIITVLSNGLKANFAEVTVSMVDCPDLTKEPFHLACSGIGGNPQLLDIGGVSYLLPLVRREKLYDLQSLCKTLKADPAFLIGAGAGPWPHLGVNCEGVTNLYVEKGVVNQKSKIASINPIGAEKGKGTCKLEELPPTETRSALLVNLLLSQGITGKVLRVECKIRTGTADFITSIRTCLNARYPDKVIGLGGVFLFKEGKSKMHVMPDFSKTSLNSNKDVEDWLHFFNMSAPLINAGTLVSSDPGLDLRLSHFHAFSQHGEGGHYHFDVTPEVAHYIGYFAIAETLVRVDQPTNILDFGKD